MAIHGGLVGSLILYSSECVEMTLCLKVHCPRIPPGQLDAAFT